jgi:ISXO2-like transposase domain
MAEIAIGVEVAVDGDDNGAENHGCRLAEGYFSVFKRGIYGTLHHIGQQHLKRYLAESDFRYNDRSALGINDKMRAAKAVKGVVGKRLTYHRPDEAAYAYAKGA